jgi:hypothetical protein
MITSLRARAKSESDTAKRERMLRMTACIHRQNTKMSVYPYKSFDDCVANTELLPEDREAVSSGGDYEAAEKQGSPSAWIGSFPGSTVCKSGIESEFPCPQ